VTGVLRCCLVLAALSLGVGCHAGGSPKLTLIGVHGRAAGEVVLVQVTNPATRPLRLTRLEYTFAAAGTTISQGDVELSRDVDPGAAVVVEVPIERPAGADDSAQTTVLSGTLTAQDEELVRTFPVSAKLAPHPAP
jgi:hypothetical protein